MAVVVTKKGLKAKHRASTAESAGRVRWRITGPVVRIAVSLVGLLAQFAWTGEALAAPLPPPRVSLLTMGPGNTLVTMFGHDALLVEQEGIRPLVYNFGMYTPESITTPRILAGHLRFFLSVEPYERTVAQYKREGRSLMIQRLGFPPEAATAVARALSENSLPQNAAYRYDYGLDNCTTRVRDAVDRGFGGALKKSLAGDTSRTYRDHALRLTAEHPFHAFAFDLGLGPRADRPLSGWDDAYLPDRLAAAVRAARLPNGAALIEKEEVLYAGLRQVRDAPPVRAPWFVLKGLILGGLFWFFGRRPGALHRALFGGLAALVGFLSGLTGLWLLALLVTNVHPVTHGNVNVLFSPPWALGLAGAGIGAAFGHARSVRWLARWAIVCGVGAVVGVLAALLVGQNAWSVVALFVPMWAGLYAGARALKARTP